MKKNCLSGSLVIRVLPSFMFIVAGLHSSAQLQWTLDENFGYLGCAASAFNDGFNKAHGLVVQPDGKIIAAGFAQIDDEVMPTIVRLDANGDPDPAFGNGSGQVSVSSGMDETHDAVRPVALDSEGRIVMVAQGHVGKGDNDFFTARFLSDGTADPSFGIGGSVMTSVSDTHDYASAVAVQSDNKVVVVGQSEFFGAYWVSVVRYHEDGEIDSTFSDDGIFRYTLSDLDHMGRDLAILPDGDILVYAQASTETGTDLLLIRLNSDGTFDEPFNAEYETLLQSISLGVDIAAGMVVQNDGMILTCGSYQAESGYDLMVSRFTPEGVLDTEFGENGSAVFSLENGFDMALGIALQPDGKILVAGTDDAGGGSGYSMVVMRLNLDGTMDESFGTDGLILTPATDGSHHGEAIAVQSDGRILVAGWGDVASLSDAEYIVCRYWETIVEGVEESANQIGVYPVPAGARLNLRSAYPLPASVTISDMSGRTWQKPVFHSGIELADLPAGLYVLHMEGSTQAIRFIHKE